MNSTYVLGGSPVPLKKNERHCFCCSGYGYNPVDKNRETIASGVKKCFECKGKGKV